MLYIGKVIRDTDTTRSETTAPPRPKNTVLVRIDGVSFTNKESEQYKFPLGKNVNGSLTDDNLELLDKTEIYAYVSTAVMGNDGLGNYTAEDDTASVVEGNDISLRASGEGYPPAYGWDRRVFDSYTRKPGSSANVNTHGASYRTDYRSNQAQGTHAVPGIGCTVLVQFINGSRNSPVIVGVIHGSKDTENVHSNSSPGVYPMTPGAAGDFTYKTKQARDINLD
jgi:hypothetical protein